MWLFTKDGFYSVVEHRDDVGCVLVRCRTKADAQALVEWAVTVRNADPDIEEDPTADYRWRVKMVRADFAAYARERVMTIDYDTSVKTAIDKGEPARHAALMKVWNALYELQRLEQAPVSANLLEPVYGYDKPVDGETDEWVDVYNDVTLESLAVWLDDNVPGAANTTLGDETISTHIAEALLKRFEMYRIEG